MQDFKNMEGFQVKISKKSKEINFIQTSKVDEKVKEALVKEMKDKRRKFDRSYFRKRFKEVKEVKINDDAVEKYCEKWKKFLVSLIIFCYFWD